MAENNEVAVKEPEKKKSSFGAACKEFFRKQTVSLKRKPQNIAFLFVLVACIYNLLVLGTYSEAVIIYAPGRDWLGLMVFVNTLFSLLSVVVFGRTFPKMKKPPKRVKLKGGGETYKERKSVLTYRCGSTKINISITMLCLFFAMIILMIVCEAVYYNLLNPWYLSTYVNYDPTNMTESEIALKVSTGSLFKTTLTYSIVHIVLLGVAAVVTALVPLYTKLLVKINTSKVVEGAVENMQEIDLAEDE